MIFRDHTGGLGGLEGGRTGSWTAGGPWERDGAWDPGVAEEVERGGQPEMCCS